MIKKRNLIPKKPKLSSAIHHGLPYQRALESINIRERLLHKRFSSKDLRLRIPTINHLLLIHHRNLPFHTSRNGQARSFSV